VKKKKKRQIWDYDSNTVAEKKKNRIYSNRLLTKRRLAKESAEDIPTITHPAQCQGKCGGCTFDEGDPTSSVQNNLSNRDVFCFIKNIIEFLFQLRKSIISY